jgi:CBS-domain-containing membrane protein
MVGLATLATLPLVAVPFATSIVLVMATPERVEAQPRNIVGGHVLCALAGFIVALAFGTHAWAAGLAVALAMAAMQLTRTLHPPAAIDAYLFVTLPLDWSFVVMPVGVGALLLVAFAYAYHRLAWSQPWPLRWW